MSLLAGLRSGGRGFGWASLLGGGNRSSGCCRRTATCTTGIYKIEISAFFSFCALPQLLLWTERSVNVHGLCVDLRGIVTEDMTGTPVSTDNSPRIPWLCPLLGSHAQYCWESPKKERVHTVPQHSTEALGEPKRKGISAHTICTAPIPIYHQVRGKRPYRRCCRR